MSISTHKEITSTAQQRFEDYLQSRGMRNTEQRRVLINLVFSEQEHFDADQLMERLPKKGTKGYVSRPTVYRTLNESVDAGLLKKFDLDGRSVFQPEFGYPQHDHFYCSRCQKLIEFQCSELSDNIQRIADEHNFQARAHRVLITGICGDCRQNRQRKRRRVDRI